MFHLLSIVITVATFGLIIAALIDIAQYIRANVVWGIIWVAVILTFPILGSICYFQFGVKQVKPRRRRRFDPDLQFDDSELV